MKVIRVKLNQRFKLPSLGKETFASLMQARLKYDKVQKGFYVDATTDLDMVNAILSFKKVMIILEKKCVICGRSIDCEKCEQFYFCDKKQSYCVCKDCLSANDAFLRYVEAQKRLLASLK